MRNDQLYTIYVAFIDVMKMQSLQVISYVSHLWTRRKDTKKWTRKEDGFVVFSVFECQVERKNRMTECIPWDFMTVYKNKKKNRRDTLFSRS